MNPAELSTLPTTSPALDLSAHPAGGPGWATGVVTETTTPEPAPTDPLRPDLEPTDVSPGLPGFLAIFVLAAASVVLFFGLSRQLRRMRHNAEQQGKLGEPEPDGSGTDPSATTGAGDEGAKPSAGAEDGAGPGRKD